MADLSPELGNERPLAERAAGSDIVSRLRSALGGKFDVERELGEGGMATVYLARDLRHGRHVALKVLRPDVARSLGAERFLREIQTASYLLHPHILPLHDSGDADGLLYYVMPYVRDQSLAEWIERAGRLPLEPAVRIAREVADALAYAHAQGVVHRDVKPGNILLPGGVHACLADFGLAHAILGAANQRLTATGIPLGSPLYMSPEQIAGRREVDARTDVYSLGCVLFEMLSGRPVFTRPSVEAVLAAHLTASVSPLRELAPDVPAELEEIVARALEKEPADRLDAAEMQALLAAIGVDPRSTPARPGVAIAIGSVTEPVGPPRVLVLPFAELSESHEHGFLGVGLTDEIITSLSHMEALRVISRSAALQLQGTTKAVRRLGAELNVQYVVEGSIQRSDDQLRVSVQVARAEDEQLLWAETFPGRVADLFEIEETIARAIVAALEIRLSPREHARLAERPIPDVRAYEYYLRAKQQVFAFTAEALDRALEYLERGAALVGQQNPMLTAAKGYVYWQYYNAGISPDPFYLDRALACGNQLFALDPDSPEAHRLVGLVRVHRHEGDLRRAIHHLKATLAVRPDDTDALFWLVLLYGFVGRCAAGQPLMQRLLEIDPLTPLNRILPGFLAALDGDFEAACPLLLEAHEADPDNPIVLCFYAQVLAMCGRRAEADDAFARLERDHPGNFFALLATVYRKALANDRAGTLTAVTSEVAEACRVDFQYSWSLAQCHAMVGETEAGLSWLENAANLGFVNYPLLAHADPLLQSVHRDPAFRRVGAGIRKKWVAFEG